MKSVLISTWALLVGFSFVLTSVGLQGPLVALRAFDEGFDTSDTGLVMAGMFAGYLLGALIAPPLIRHVGHVKVFAAAASLGSGSVLLFMVFADPLVWLALRVVNGCSIATICVVTEAWLNQSSSNEVRGKIMNLYAMICNIGLGAGALLLNLGDPRGVALFILCSLLISFGIVPVLLSARPAPTFERPKRLGFVAMFRRSPIGVGAIFLAGFAVGALVAASPIFADKSGLTTAEVSIFVATIFLGSLIFQWPIGYLADRFDRIKVLVAVVMSAALLALLLSVTPLDLGVLVYLLIGLFSGLCLSLYALCSAITNDHLERDEMVGGGMTLYICYSVGATIGPVLVTELMEAWRASAFFYFLAGVCLLIAAYAVALRSGHRAANTGAGRATRDMDYRHSHWIIPGGMDQPSETERTSKRPLQSRKDQDSREQ
ncbi:MAG: MFS transporter [Pseudomonadota bacterium]